LFLVPGRHEMEPYEQDGLIECWIKPRDSGGTDRSFDDAAHCDFWRAAPTGRAFIMRGYQEDAQDTFRPRTVMDTTLPVWRIGEALLHAERLAILIADDPEKINVRFRALYTGLTGRRLRAWANPLSDLVIEGGAASSDEALLETSASVKKIAAVLPEVVQPLVASLFERFGVTGLSVDRVRSELDKMRQNHFPSARR
jgi:hypothetical protein